jgi:hypothetical protein
VEKTPRRSDWQISARDFIFPVTRLPNADAFFRLECRGRPSTILLRESPLSAAKELGGDTLAHAFYRHHNDTREQRPG